MFVSGKDLIYLRHPSTMNADRSLTVAALIRATPIRATPIRAATVRERCPQKSCAMSPIA